MTVAHLTSTSLSAGGIDHRRATTTHGSPADRRPRRRAYSSEFTAPLRQEGMRSAKSAHWAKPSGHRWQLVVDGRSRDARAAVRQAPGSAIWGRLPTHPKRAHADPLPTNRRTDHASFVRERLQLPERCTLLSHLLGRRGIFSGVRANRCGTALVWPRFERTSGDQQQATSECR
jgi:hypothetical protein